MQIIFSNATIVNPGEVLTGCTVVVDNGKFVSIRQSATTAADRESFLLDAGKWYLFPGLINIHDHFRGSWLPRCGNGPYQNVYQWLAELHAKPSVFPPARERDRISMRNLYWLGTYKNLFSGVTTAVDHYLRIDPALYSDLPIRIITDFGREGVVRTYHEPELFPSWGEGLLKEYKDAQESGRPFIIHVEEGVDEETGTELRRLNKWGILGPNSILVHGIGFDEGDMQIVAQNHCHMVWCPATHEFLYGRTSNIPRWLELGINTSLGTDSSLTGGLNLLDEMRTARRFHGQVFGKSLPLEELFKMVTVNPACALQIAGHLGRIAEGFTADLLVLERMQDGTPLETLIAAEPRDIVLVLQEGRPRYGDEHLAYLFEAAGEPYGSAPVFVGGRAKRVVGRPVELLEKVWEEIARRYIPAFLPLDDAAHP
ncbi:MAG: amidohydrolase family protein [Candidatus Sumerlaeia bacterium]|nr:amidohydrolase family protein [Candidatus Sumerlaeia bacterium]